MKTLLTTTLTRSALAVLALSVTAACGGSQPKAGAPAGGGGAPGLTVSIPLLSFSPTALTIHKGQTVTWVNGNDINHVLVEGTYQVGSDGLRTSQTDDMAFRLSVAKKGDVVKHTYDTVGTFTYYCTIHHGMNAAVTVTG